jgi:transposase-like protein
MSKTTNKFSPEVRSRAVRLVLEHEHEHLWCPMLDHSRDISSWRWIETGTVRSRGPSSCITQAARSNVSTRVVRSIVLIETTMAVLTQMSCDLGLATAVVSPALNAVEGPK